jgi:hypothetical protein
MLTEEPTQYLSLLKEFLLQQQVKTCDPTIEELIAQINRELWLRTERGPVL